MTGVELAEIALTVIECPVCRSWSQYCDKCREELKVLVDNDPDLVCCDYGFSDDPIDKS